MLRSTIVRGVHHDILFSHWQSVLLRGVWNRTLYGREPSDKSDTDRVAPVPIYYADLFPDDIAKLCRLAEESSLPTHASGQCRSACRYMALLLAGLMHGLHCDEVLSPTREPLQQLRATGPLHPAIDEIAAGSFRDRQPPQIVDSGYVVQSLEAALWAFHDAQDSTPRCGMW